MLFGKIGSKNERALKKVSHVQLTYINHLNGLTLVMTFASTK